MSASASTSTLSPSLRPTIYNATSISSSRSSSPSSAVSTPRIPPIESFEQGEYVSSRGARYHVYGGRNVERGEGGEGREQGEDVGAEDLKVVVVVGEKIRGRERGYWR